MTDDITQRDVLRGLSGLALTGAIGCRELDPGEPGESAIDIDRSIAGVGTCAGATIAAVANRQIAVDTVEAYAQKSVAAGETIDFRVSSPVPYQLSIVRLGWDTDTPVRNWTLHTFPQAAAANIGINSAAMGVLNRAQSLRASAVGVANTASTNESAAGAATRKNPDDERDARDIIGRIANAATRRSSPRRGPPQWSSTPHRRGPPGRGA